MKSTNLTAFKTLSKKLSNNGYECIIYKSNSLGYILFTFDPNDVGIVYAITEDDDLSKSVFPIGNIDLEKDSISIGMDYFYPKNGTFEHLMGIFRDKRKDIVNRLLDNIEISKYDYTHINNFCEEIFTEPKKVIEEYIKNETLKNPEVNK